MKIWGIINRVKISNNYKRLVIVGSSIMFLVIVFILNFNNLKIIAYSVTGNTEEMVRILNENLSSEQTEGPNKILINYVLEDQIEDGLKMMDQMIFSDTDRNLTIKNYILNLYGEKGVTHENVSRVLEAYFKANDNERNLLKNILKNYGEEDVFSALNISIEQAYEKGNAIEALSQILDYMGLGFDNANRIYSMKHDLTQVVNFSKSLSEAEKKPLGELTLNILKNSDPDQLDQAFASVIHSIVSKSEFVQEDIDLLEWYLGFYKDLAVKISPDFEKVNGILMDIQNQLNRIDDEHKLQKDLNNQLSNLKKSMYDIVDDRNLKTDAIIRNLQKVTDLKMEIDNLDIKSLNIIGANEYDVGVYEAYNASTLQKCIVYAPDTNFKSWQMYKLDVVFLGRQQVRFVLGNTAVWDSYRLVSEYEKNLLNNNWLQIEDLKNNNDDLLMVLGHYFANMNDLAIEVDNLVEGELIASLTNEKVLSWFIKENQQKIIELLARQGNVDDSKVEIPSELVYFFELDTKTGSQNLKFPLVYGIDENIDYVKINNMIKEMCNYTHDLNRQESDYGDYEFYQNIFVNIKGVVKGNYLCLESDTRYISTDNKNDVTSFKRLKMIDLKSAKEIGIDEIFSEDINVFNQVQNILLKDTEFSKLIPNFEVFNESSINYGFSKDALLIEVYRDERVPVNYAIPFEKLRDFLKIDFLNAAPQVSSIY